MGTTCNGEMNLFLVLSLSQYCFLSLSGNYYLFVFSCIPYEEEEVVVSKGYVFSSERTKIAFSDGM